VEIQSGDVLLVRTGHMSTYLARNSWDHFDLDDSPGVSVHTTPWLHARQGDYRDMPPSRGVYKGDCESQLAVGVTVRRARAAVAEPEFMRLAQPNFSGGRRRAQPGLVMQQDQQQQQ
jgi:hypothetical protein